MLSRTAAVDLAEALEQMLSLFVGEAATGIDDLESDELLVPTELALPLRHDTAAHKNLSGLCELDSVPNDVEQDLSDAETIAPVSYTHLTLPTKRIV